MRNGDPLSRVSRTTCKRITYRQCTYFAAWSRLWLKEPGANYCLVFGPSRGIQAVVFMLRNSNRLISRINELRTHTRNSHNLIIEIAITAVRNSVA